MFLPYSTAYKLQFKIYRLERRSLICYTVYNLHGMLKSLPVLLGGEKYALGLLFPLSAKFDPWQNLLPQMIPVDMIERIKRGIR